jgi:hypothetical protein
MVTVLTDRGEEKFCFDCRFPHDPFDELDHSGLEGYAPEVVGDVDRNPRRDGGPQGVGGDA